MIFFLLLLFLFIFIFYLTMQTGHDKHPLFIYPYVFHHCGNYSNKSTMVIKDKSLSILIMKVVATKPVGLYASLIMVKNQESL